MQKLQLSIPEPCHESWQQMTPTEQGRFCNACAKEVIDFSTMTDIQVLNYFTNLTHEKVCGRALPEQLGRTINRPEHAKKKLFWYWNYIVMFLMFFTKGSNASAQNCAKPATELNRVKNLDVKGKMTAVEGKRIITGKVTDIDGNPIAFASVKMKGSNTGVSADANGVYSLIIKPNSILIITGISFKDTEVPITDKSTVNIVMEKDPLIKQKEMVVTIAGGIRRTRISETNKTIKANPVIVFKVKEDNTELVIENAVITITRNNNFKSDTAINKKKGIYEFKKIEEGNSYLIKVEAINYQPNEFTIDESDFKDGKKVWQILLKKQNSAFGTRISNRSSAQNPLGGMQVHVVGQTKVDFVNSDSLYIIDGLMSAKKVAENLSPDDISEIKELKPSEATALFGPEALNGAIVITTRKTKAKTLDTVAVSSGYDYRRRMAGGIGYTIICTKSYGADIKARILTTLTDSLKVYPNPVQRNSTFSVSLKLREAGNYQIQITDALERIVLQKKINSVGKYHNEILKSQNWSGGIYNVRVFSKNQLISKAGFIVQ